MNSTGSGENRASSPWEDWIEELRARAPTWRVFPWFLNTAGWLPQDRPRVYTVGLHASLAVQHILPPPTPASPISLLDILHPGLPHIREVGLTPQQCENLVVAKAEAMSHPGRLATVSLDRSPTAIWPTGVGVRGVVGALRTGNDLIWLLQYDGALRHIVFSRCLHPLERCKGSGRSSWRI